MVTRSVREFRARLSNNARRLVSFDEIRIYDAVVVVSDTAFHCSPENVATLNDRHKRAGKR